MDDVAVDAVIRRVAEGLGDVVEFVARPGALLRLVVDLVREVVRLDAEDVGPESEEVRLVVVEEMLEFVILRLLVLFAMAVESVEGAADEGMTERVMLVQVLLTATDELKDEQIVEQRPRFLDDDLGDRPVVVAFLARLGM